MKKLHYLFCLAAILLSGLTLSSCNEPENLVVDWSNVTLSIYIYDTQGKNIARAEMPGLTLTFQGKTHELQPVPFDGYSRANAPHFEGFYYDPGYNFNGENDWPHLCFGELDGAANMDEDIILTWPDGTTDTIHYHCSKHNERKLTCKRYWKVNGVKQESSDIYLIHDLRL